MKKILKSILIATASIGIVAGSITTVVSCGEEIFAVQKDYDSLVQKIVNHFNNNSNIITMKHAGIEDTSTKAAVNYIQDEIHSYIQNGADVTANERLTVNNVTVNSTDATFDTVKGDSIGHANVSINPNNNLRPADLSNFTFTYSVWPNKNDLESTGEQYKIALSQIMNYIPEGTYYLKTGAQTDVTELQTDITSYIKFLITKNKGYMFGALSADNIVVSAPANAFQTSSTTTTDAESGDISITIHSSTSGIADIVQKMKVKYQVLDSATNINLWAYNNQVLLTQNIMTILGMNFYDAPVILFNKYAGNPFSNIVTSVCKIIDSTMTLLGYTQRGLNSYPSDNDPKGVDIATSTATIRQSNNLTITIDTPSGLNESFKKNMNVKINYIVFNTWDFEGILSLITPILNQQMSNLYLEFGLNKNVHDNWAINTLPIYNLIRSNPVFASSYAYDGYIDDASTRDFDMYVGRLPNFNITTSSLITRQNAQTIEGLEIDNPNVKIPRYTHTEYKNIISAPGKYFVTDDTDKHIERNAIASVINSTSSYNPVVIKSSLNDTLSQSVSIQSSLGSVINSLLVDAKNSQRVGTGVKFALQNILGITDHTQNLSGTILYMDPISTAIPTTPGMHTVTLHNIMFKPTDGNITKLFDTLDLQVMVE